MANLKYDEKFVAKIKALAVKGENIPATAGDIPK